MQGIKGGASTCFLLKRRANVSRIETQLDSFSQVHLSSKLESKQKIGTLRSSINPEASAA